MPNPITPSDSYSRLEHFAIATVCLTAAFAIAAAIWSWMIWDRAQPVLIATSLIAVTMSVPVFLERRG